jgi:hypothetical protein
MQPRIIDSLSWDDWIGSLVWVIVAEKIGSISRDAHMVVRLTMTVYDVKRGSPHG